jgi:HMG (high mobility group) box
MSKWAESILPHSHPPTLTETSSTEVKTLATSGMRDGSTAYVLNTDYREAISSMLSLSPNNCILRGSVTPHGGTLRHNSEVDCEWRNNWTLTGDDSTKPKQMSHKRKLDHGSKMMPVRPLTGYNFFFRFERGRILKDMGAAKDNENKNGGLVPPNVDPFAWILENKALFKDGLLHEQWNRNPAVKRIHSKSHGRISFQALTLEIAQRWRNLSDPVKRVFQEMAAKDFDRYTRELKPSLLERKPLDQQNTQWDA